MPVDPTRYGDVLPGDSGDALLNLWILDWVGHHLGFRAGPACGTRASSGRNHNTLAYSESLLPVAVVHRGLSAVLGSDVLAFNVIYVAVWTLSGWITYLLARRLSGSTGGAIVAGLVYTVATPRLAHYGHFQLAMDSSCRWCCCCLSVSSMRPASDAVRSSGSRPHCSRCRRATTV